MQIQLPDPPGWCPVRACPAGFLPWNADNGQRAMCRLKGIPMAGENPHSTRDAPALWVNGLSLRALGIIFGDGQGSPHVNWLRDAPLRKVASGVLIYHAYTGKNPQQPARGGLFQWPDWPRRPVAITIRFPTGKRN